MLERSHKANERNLMADIAAISNLDRAYEELKSSRIERDHRDLFFSLPPREQLLADLRQKLQSGTYCFTAVKQIRCKDGHWVSEWEPEDIIVLKAMTYKLTPLFCQKMDLTQATHLKGNGGLKGAVRSATRYCTQYKSVIKTDIAKYYESMDHHGLHDMLCEHVSDPRVKRLLWQVLDRVHVYNGCYREIKRRGIPRGCPLSPLFSAIYLKSIDDWAKRHGVGYVRYMDDFVIFVNGRKNIRKRIKELYQLLKPLGLKLSIPKTWIGNVKRGFSFLGYQISPKEIAGISNLMATDCVKGINQRYAQGATVICN